MVSTFNKSCVVENNGMVSTFNKSCIVENNGMVSTFNKRKQARNTKGPVLPLASGYAACPVGV